MIDQIYYQAGVKEAHAMFKVANVPVMNFPKKVAPAAPPAAPPVASAAPKGPVFGGAAAPGAPGAAPAKKPFMDTFGGQMVSGLGIPVAAGLIQNALTPAPKDPNGL